MLQIEKYKNAFGYNIYDITTHEGCFKIYFSNNLDLYWCVLDITDELYKEFTITKENNFIFSLFDKLFNCIKDNEPFLNSKNNKTINKRKIFTSDIQKQLFKDNKIIWHSDNEVYDLSSSVTISKINNEEFKILFKKNIEFPQKFSVRFCNSGSRYNPFNVTFMNLYHNLEDYNFDYQESENIKQKIIIKK